MAKVRCQFCHEDFDESEIQEHQAKHLKKRPDGQQTDYATLPPEERVEGDLSSVPKVYVHLKCKVGTGMPEDIIRSYLKNPFMYMSNRTFCCGCRRHVPFSECVWTETGEDLQTYMDKLRATKPEMQPKGCFGAILIVGLGLSGWAATFLV